MEGRYRGDERREGWKEQIKKKKKKKDGHDNEASDSETEKY